MTTRRVFDTLPIYMTTIDPSLIATLKLIGLNKNEAQIYLACLELGPSSAWDIFQKSGIKRATCYAILDNLVADGIAAKTLDKKRTIYSVVSPDELLASIDSRRKQFKEMVPLLNAVASQSAVKPQIRLLEGIEGVRQAYMLGLNQPESSELILFGTADFWLANAAGNEVYIKERVHKQISLRALLPNTEAGRQIAKKDKQKLRELRFLSKNEYDPRVETQIFGNTVVFIAHSEKEPFATVVENAALAWDERQRFELLWNSAKA